MDISVKGLRLSSEICNHEFGSYSLLLEESAGNLSRWWSALFENPLNNGVLGSTSVVVNSLTVPENKIWLKSNPI